MRNELDKVYQTLRDIVDKYEREAMIQARDIKEMDVYAITELMELNRRVAGAKAAQKALGCVTY